MVVDSPKPWVGLFMRPCVLLCAICVILWVGPRWTAELFISPCELIVGVIAMNE